MAATYPASTRVYSFLGGNQYLEKRVDDLGEDEDLLWYNLSGDPRYDLDWSPLFTQRFFETAAEEGLISLENRLREDGTRLIAPHPDSDVDAAARYVHEKLSALNDRRLSEIEYSTVLGWFNGTTAVPDNPETALGLGMALEDPTFLRWYAKIKRKLYCVKVSEVKRPEKEDLSLVNGTSVRTMDAERAYTGGPGENVEIKTFKDVFEDFAVLKEAYAGLVQEWVSGMQEGRYEDSDPYVKDFLKRFKNHPLHNSVLNQHVAAREVNNDNYLFLFKFAVAESESNLEQEELENLANEYNSLINRKAESGEIDKAVGAEEFTTKKLGNLVYALPTTVPTDLRDYVIYRSECLGLEDRLNREPKLIKVEKEYLERDHWQYNKEIPLLEEELKDSKKEMDRLKSIMERKYEVDITDFVAGHTMLKSRVDSILIRGYQDSKDKADKSGDPDYFKNINSHVDSVYDPSGDAFKPLSPHVEADQFTTRNAAYRSLNSYGLESAFRFIDDLNFVFDPEPFEVLA